MDLIKQLLWGLCARIAWADEDGATAVEYGIMVALIAVVIVVAVRLLGTQLNSVFCSVVKEFGGSC